MHVDPDGRFRCVIAHRDPGVPNWLDACGHPEGMIQYRFVWARSRPAADAAAGGAGRPAERAAGRPPEGLPRAAPAGARRARGPPPAPRAGHLSQDAADLTERFRRPAGNPAPPCEPGHSIRRMPALSPVRSAALLALGRRRLALAAGARPPSRSRSAHRRQQRRRRADAATGVGRPRQQRPRAGARTAAHLAGRRHPLPGSWPSRAAPRSTPAWVQFESRRGADGSPPRSRVQGDTDAAVPALHRGDRQRLGAAAHSAASVRWTPARVARRRRAGAESADAEPRARGAGAGERRPLGEGDPLAPDRHRHRPPHRALP